MHVSVGFEKERAGSGRMGRGKVRKAAERWRQKETERKVGQKRDRDRERKEGRREGRQSE